MDKCADIVNIEINGVIKVMGLAASQARFLGLTARKSNNEYQVQQINEQRLALADNQTPVTLDYQKKMTNRNFYFKTVNENGDDVVRQLKYWDIVNPISITDKEKEAGMTTGMGNRIVDVNGNIVVPNYPSNNTEEIQAIINKYNVTEDTKDNTKLYANIENGTWIMQAKRTTDDGNEFWFDIPFDEADFIAKMRAQNPDDETDTEYWRLYNTLIEKINGKYQELTYENLTSMKDLGIEIRLRDKEEKIVVPELPEADRSIVFGKYCVDSYCVDPKYLEEKLRNGEWFIQQPSTTSDTGWTNNLSWSSIGYILDDYDTSDDAAAESEYEYLMAKLAKQDKMLELRLKQLETEHKALETELDSVSKVIQTNIDGSFKTFA